MTVVLSEASEQSGCGTVRLTAEAPTDYVSH